MIVLGSDRVWLAKHTKEEWGSGGWVTCRQADHAHGGRAEI